MCTGTSVSHIHNDVSPLITQPIKIFQLEVGTPQSFKINLSYAKNNLGGKELNA